MLDPAGDYAYVMVTQSTNVNASVTGVEAFSVASDGKLGSGKTTGLNPLGSIPVSPVAMVIDSEGKFLFVADAAVGSESGRNVSSCPSSNGAFTEVSGSPFPLPAQPGGTTPNRFRAGRILQRSIPRHIRFCSANVPPATENLYVTDSVNYDIGELLRIVVRNADAGANGFDPGNSNRQGTFRRDGRSLQPFRLRIQWAARQ